MFKKMGFTAKVVTGMIVLLVVINLLTSVSQRSATLYRHALVGIQNNTESTVRILEFKRALTTLMIALERCVIYQHRDIDVELQAEERSFAKWYADEEMNRLYAQTPAAVDLKNTIGSLRAAFLQTAKKAAGLAKAGDAGAARESLESGACPAFTALLESTERMKDFSRTSTAKAIR